MDRGEGEKLRQDGEAVARRMQQALVDLLGTRSSNIAAAIDTALANDEITWPDPSLIAHLDARFPGFAEEWLNRVEEIQRQEHAEDAARPPLSRTERIKAFGRGMIGRV